MKQPLWVNALIGGTVFLVYWALVRMAKRRPRRVKGTVLQSQLEKGLKFGIVDVRNPDEFQKGRIPGSKLIPLDKLAERLQHLNPQQEWVIVCQSGARAAKAYRFLHEKGYERLWLLTGGIKAYPGKLER